MREDPIIVGYDGSAGADAALAWGLSEAALHAVAAHVVTVVDTRGDAVAGGPGDLAHMPVVAAKSAVARIVLRASTEAPGVEVTGRVVAGPVTGTLCDLSWAASTLVVGCRGQGGFGGLRVGSVSLAATVHAHCPVVAIPEGWVTTAGQPVLLGVDDCPHGRLAALFAFEEAAARGVGVYAVRAVAAQLRRGLSVVRGDEWSGSQQALVDDVLADCRERYPDVDVVTRVVAGSPGEVLAGESGQAQLLVVGSRGRGGFHGLLLGSVGNLALHHARCPVAVVRERAVAVRPPARSAGVAEPPARLEQ